MNLTVSQEVDCKRNGHLKSLFFCTSNVCLLPCDALFLRCIGVDGATFVGRSPVPFKSKRGQLQNKTNISMQPFIFLVLSTFIDRISNPICLSVYCILVYEKKNKFSTINTLSSPYLLVVSLGLVI